MVEHGKRYFACDGTAAPAASRDIYDGAERRIAPKALDTFKTRVREQTCRTRGLSLTQIV